MEEQSKDKIKEKTGKANHINVDSLILVTLVVVLGVLLATYFFTKKNPQTSSKSMPLKILDTPATQISSAPSIKPTITLTPSPTPKPIPHGSSDFFVSVGKEKKGPRMGKGTINPYDPEIGGKQGLTIAIADTVPVTKVVAILKTDKKTSEPHALLLGTGTNMSGSWTGEWVVDDSYLYTYVLSIQATSASGTSSVDITLR